jgi:hypothetical protein
MCFKTLYSKQQQEGMGCPYYEKMSVSQDITKGGWRRHRVVLDSRLLELFHLRSERNDKTPGLI